MGHYSLCESRPVCDVYTPQDIAMHTCSDGCSNTWGARLHFCMSYVVNYIQSAPFAMLWNVLTYPAQLHLSFWHLPSWPTRILSKLVSLLLSFCHSILLSKRTEDKPHATCKPCLAGRKAVQLHDYLQLGENRRGWCVAFCNHTSSSSARHDHTMIVSWTGGQKTRRAAHRVHWSIQAGLSLLYNRGEASTSNPGNGWEVRCMVHLLSHAVSRPEDRLRKIDSRSIPRFCHSKAKHARSAPHFTSKCAPPVPWTDPGLHCQDSLLLQTSVITTFTEIMARATVCYNG